MSGLYRELAERFRGEVVDLDRAAQRALRAWERTKAAENDRNLYLDSRAEFAQLLFGSGAAV